MFSEECAKILDTEDGAITVDWVVITALIVSLGFITTVFIWEKTRGVSRNLSHYVGTQEIRPTFTGNELGK